MHFFPFLLVVLVYFCLGLKQLESTTLKFNTTDDDHSILKPDNITIHPECQSKCGDLLVPYPFGINSNGLKCSINPLFAITCNITTNSSEAFLMDGNVQVYDISNSELRISNSVASRCYDQFGNVTSSKDSSINLGATTYFYSAANVFTVVGCDDSGNIYNAIDGTLPKGCTTTCEHFTEVMTENETCSGSGCCQVPINVMKYFSIYLGTYYYHTNISSFNECGFAFMGEKGTFKFTGLSNLNDSNTFVQRTLDTVPVVLDWVIGHKNCVEAAQDSSSPICYSNSTCIDETQHGGYRCTCDKGYEGNPYLSPGCRDIDECEQHTHGCQQNCNNTEGSYNCYCRLGYDDIDPSNGTNCILKSSKPQVMKFALGIVFCCLVVIIGLNWVYCIIKQKKHSQLREEFFKQNGGLLLSQQNISAGSPVEITKHFTYEELKKATNNYAADRVLGRGGSGIVYKGILSDQRIVAVKKSRGLDTSQIDQFINEVVILAQVNHRNVVKLLGCCLECELPLLVYEFISNGTLHHHVHSIDGGLSWLSLDNRLRIAAESSGALAYLHSAASIPILHRDVKLANILVDDNCVAKISDFGASRLLPTDQTKLITTYVEGTIGYVDPEYFQTGELTHKSDVYSFGVVLAELLTGRKPIDNSMEESNLATYFIKSLKENRLLQVLDRRVVREGTMDQLQKAAELVKRCLNLYGEERPTMKEVMMEIESLRKFSMHPWADDHGNEETMTLKGNPEIQHLDLYEIELSSYVVNDSQRYSSNTISLLHGPSTPR